MTTRLLPQARAGDAQAFAELTDPYVRELHLHCYRMLWSATDGDDVMQEVLLAAWQGLPDFEGRSSLRTWLYRIATTRCLNAIRTVKRRAPEEPIPPFDPPLPSRRGEITWLQPYPDPWLAAVAADGVDPEAAVVRREHIELAFITALQCLPPRQTAAVILVDVLGFDRPEAASVMGTSPTAVKGTLQRARASLAADGAGESRDVAGEHEVASRFAAAFVADDIDAITEMLADRAWLAMPPAPHEYHGPIAIGAFLRASAQGRGDQRIELRPAGVNRQPAFACTFVDAEEVRRDAGVLVLTVDGASVVGITRFLGARPADTIGSDIVGPFATQVAREEQSWR